MQLLVVSHSYNALFFWCPVLAASFSLPLQWALVPAMEPGTPGAEAGAAALRLERLELVLELRIELWPGAAAGAELQLLLLEAVVVAE